MDYYIAVAIVIAAFLAIILHSKKALTQESASCTCGHDCGTCKGDRPLTVESDRSAEFDHTRNRKSFGLNRTLTGNEMEDRLRTAE